MGWRHWALCMLAAGLLFAGAASAFGPGAKGYAGSEKCRECHEDIYSQWRKTPHANMLRDATKDPDAVAAKEYSGVPFTRQDIRWTIGSGVIRQRPETRSAVPDPLRNNLATPSNV